MPEALATVGSGILGFLGQNNTNQTNTQNVQATNAANQALLTQTESYNQTMSDTSYQRSMLDMQKAGLNPMLAYMKGGASAPTASAPTMQAPQVGNALGAGVNSAMAGMSLSKDMQQKSTQIGLNKAQKDLVDSQVGLTDNNAETAAATTRAAEAKADMLEAQLPAAVKQANFDAKYAGLDAIQKRTSGVTGVVSSGASLAKQAYDWATSDSRKIQSDADEMKALQQARESGVPVE